MRWFVDKDLFIQRWFKTSGKLQKLNEKRLYVGEVGTFEFPPTLNYYIREKLHLFPLALTFISLRKVNIKLFNI